jgi:glucan-binding YG repeat protein
MDTGWTDLEGSRYFFGEDGAMTLGFLNHSNETYYFDENGAMVTG